METELEYFSHSLIKPNILKLREYQKNISDMALKNNCLCVLPTGVGKTIIALVVAVERLSKYTESKIIILAPSKPLTNQHKQTFEKFSNINPETLIVLTGQIKPEDRKELYNHAKIIFSTPQTTQNDLKTGILNLDNCSLIVFDEAHRCVKEYSYTFVAKKYIEQAKNPLILGLTASPGGTVEKINEIRDNLFIEAVEIRSEYDEDVGPYVKEIAKDWIYVELPEEFQKIKTLIEEPLKENIFWLRDHHLIQTLKPSKKLLLTLQNKIMARYIQGSKNYAMMWAMMRTVESVKLDYVIELLETQNISSLIDYLKKFEKSKKKTEQRIMKDPRVREAITLAEEVKAKGVEHPKLLRLLEIVKSEVEKNPHVKIIVFANYRATVDRINEMMKSNGIKSEILIGQATKEKNGMTQEKQIETIKNFGSGMFTTLVSTQISEEGLDIGGGIDLAIFYEAVSSEIRSIQRKGRVGRQTAGKVVFLITKGTRDEAYYWVATHREKKMKGILYDLKERGIKARKKKTLSDWVGS